jgi:hypothetical protein
MESSFPILGFWYRSWWPKGIIPRCCLFFWWRYYFIGNIQYLPSINKYMCLLLGFQCMGGNLIWVLAVDIKALQSPLCPMWLVFAKGAIFGMALSLSSLLFWSGEGDEKCKMLFLLFCGWWWWAHQPFYFKGVSQNSTFMTQRAQLPSPVSHGTSI